MEGVLDGSKACSKCGVVQPIDNFYFSKTWNRVVAACKNCTYVQAKQYRLLNCEKMKVYQKNYRQSHKEITREYFINYRASNRNCLLAKKRAYYRLNKDKIRFNRINDRPRVYAWNANYRGLRKKLLHPDCDEIQVSRIYKVCKWLNENHPYKRYDVDHIYPLSKGGPQHHDNLQIIDRTINRMKHNSLSFKHPSITHWSQLPASLIDWINLNKVERMVNFDS